MVIFHSLPEATASVCQARIVPNASGHASIMKPFLVYQELQISVLLNCNWCGHSGYQWLTNWLVVWNMNVMFPYIGNNHPDWLIFFTGVGTTNQLFMFRICCLSVARVSLVRSSNMCFVGALVWLKPDMFAGQPPIFTSSLLELHVFHGKIHFIKP